MEKYPGKFLVRIPKSLHRALTRAAKHEGVSLNQYVTTLLASGVYGDVMATQINTILTKLGRTTVWFTLTPFGIKGLPQQHEEIMVMSRKQLVSKQ